MFELVNEYRRRRTLEKHPEGVAFDEQWGTETSAFDFQLLGEDTFPDESNPRVLFIGIAAGRESLIALAERLQGSLAVEGFAAEPRPFHPHVTLARTSGRRFDRELDRSVEFGDVRCDRVLLMESRAGYHERRSFPLR